MLADFGRGHHFGDRILCVSRFVKARVRVNTHGLKALGFELFGKLRNFIGAIQVYERFQIIVASVAQRRNDFLDVELFFLALRVLAPAVDIRTDQSLRRTPRLAFGFGRVIERRHYRANRDY